MLTCSAMKDRGFASYTRRRCERGFMATPPYNSVLTRHIQVISGMQLDCVMSDMSYQWRYCCSSMPSTHRLMCHIVNWR